MAHPFQYRLASGTIDIEWWYREVGLVSPSAVTWGSEAQFHVLSVYLSGVTCWNPLLISKKTKVSEQQMQFMHVRMEVGDCTTVSIQINMAPLNFMGIPLHSPNDFIRCILFLALRAA